MSCFDWPPRSTSFPHVLAEALVRAAHERDLGLTSPEDVKEGRGQGVEGRVEGRRVAVGSSPGWASAGTWAPRRRCVRWTRVTIRGKRGSSSALLQEAIDVVIANALRASRA